jgi:hypothetical protein
LASLLKHYLVGFDRPTPGQVRTIWPPDRLPDIPGANREIIHFVERHTATIRHHPQGSVIFRVEPRQGLLLAGRFEKTKDGTRPARDVEHAHAVIIDPRPTDNNYLLPSDIRKLFVSAQEYRQKFHSLSSEFYRKVSIKLKINSQIHTNHLSNEPHSTKLKVNDGLVEHLETYANTSDENGIALLLTKLSDPLQFYVTWGFTTQPINSNRPDAYTPNPMAIDTSTTSSAPSDLPNASVTAQIFDIAAPNITIENAYEIAISVLDPNSQKIETAQAIADGLLRLVQQGIGSDRVALAICSNAPRMYRNWKDSWHDILERCLTSLYPDGWQRHIDRLGYPYLRSYIDNSGQTENVYDHSIMKNKLQDSVAKDEQYRLFLCNLKKSNNENILDLAEKLTDVSDAHVEQIIVKYDSPNMARILHQAISTDENYTPTTWPTILRMSSAVSNSKHPNQLRWWHTSLAEATDTSRSLLKKLSGGQSKLEQFAVKYYDHEIVNYIDQIAKLADADGYNRSTDNLKNLLKILQQNH